METEFAIFIFSSVIALGGIWVFIASFDDDDDEDGGGTGVDIYDPSYLGTPA